MNKSSFYPLINLRYDNKLSAVELRIINRSGRRTYHDIPIIPCKEMGSTGSGSGLSDIFILDTDHLHFATLKPTEYFETGIDSGDPFSVDGLRNRGMYRTIGEVVCTFLKGQGKITNLN